MKTSPPTRRRLILAALLSLALILSLAGLVTSSPRDPIVGSWRREGDDHSITFRPGGTFSHWANFEGTWRVIPGPYYARNPHATVPLHQIIGQYDAGYVSAHQLTPEHFQEALAQNAIHLTPASSRIRLYECNFSPLVLGNERFFSFNRLYHSPVILEDGDLMLDEMYHRQTWFTRARDWFRSILPP